MINIKGKNYITVAERVQLAHTHQFEMVESSPLPIGDRCLWKVVIEVDGKRYVGHAEVKLNAPKNLPDGTNPYECAETSAVGRALGFAGFGSVESIASAEEVILATAEQSRPSQDPDSPATLQQISTIRKLQKSLGMTELANADGLSFQDCASMLRDLQKRRA